MSEHDVTEPYVYQPYGINEHGGRIYGVAGINELKEGIKGLSKEEAEYICDALKEYFVLSKLQEKLSKLLTATANALKGEPEELHVHSWHDLAEVAKCTVDVRKLLSRILHDQVVANQAAWIEWQHGGGAERAMEWVQNGLFGPGHIPDEDEQWGKDAQAYYDANRSDPFPECFCGRPSNQLWMGKGACSSEHMKKVKEEHGEKMESNE